MKRISTALVAAAVATGLAITPAVAEENQAPESNTTAPGEGKDTKNPENPENPEDPDKGGDTKNPSKDGGKKTSTATTGSAVGSVVGILSAILTAAIVIFSNPKGIDKAIDLLNANFGLGLQKFGF